MSVTIRRHHWSRRLSLSVGHDGQVRLSIPKRTPWFMAEDFLKRSRSWIEEQLSKTPKNLWREPTPLEKRQARQLTRHKLSQWQPIVGVEARSLRIGNQRSRWGSCSSKGTLSFNWRIIELPDDIADYLIVHELAHLIQPNHSDSFWQIVESAIPDYRSRRKALRQRGHGTLTEP